MKAANAALFLASLAASLLAVEVLGRIVDYDFDQQRQTLAETPIFFVQPRIPLEPVFFHREGPTEWTGQVLYTQARRKIGEQSRLYADEPVVTARYDADGFRNSPALDDWEIVVTGDSFTELGFLAEEELFTSIAAKQLGLRVRNLGTSFTGTLSQIASFEHFGNGDSTTDAVLVFFEGNDLADLAREQQALDHFARTGQRALRELVRQSSFLKAIRDFLRRSRKHTRATHVAELALAGKRHSITVTYAPPSPRMLTPREAELLEHSIQGWSETVRAHGLRPWVAYMPCKIRVLYDQLTVGAEALQRVRDWRPNDLPEHVGKLARGSGSHFIDLTPGLQRATADGQLVFNPIWDTHLNAAGARIVGRTLAEALELLGQ